MTSTQNLPILLNWLKENHALIHPLVSFKQFESGGIGAIAMENLNSESLVYVGEDGEEQKQPLVRIPKSTIFSAKNSFISNLLEENDIDGVPALVISLIYEYLLVGEDSPWWGYFQSFDLKSVDLPPSFWPENDKQYLVGTECELLEMLDQEDVLGIFYLGANFAQKVHEEIGIEIPGPFKWERQEDLTKCQEQFAKFSVVVSSRCFNIDNYHEFAMVPAADLFNHDGEPNAHFETQGLVCDICGEAFCDHVAPDEGEEQEDEERNEDESYSNGEESDQEKQKDVSDEEFLASVINGELDENIEEEMEENSAVPEYLRDHKNDDGGEVFSIDCCDIVLDTPVEKGEQIFSTYGNLSNHMLLLKYQFIQKQNLHDYVSLGKEILSLKHSGIPKRLKWWANKGWKKASSYVYNDEDEGDDEIDNWLSEMKFGYFDSPLLTAVTNLCVVSNAEYEKITKKDKKLMKLLDETAASKKLLKQLLEKRLERLKKNKYYDADGKQPSLSERNIMSLEILEREKYLLNEGISTI